MSKSTGWRRAIFLTRYWTFRLLHTAAMRACPPGRYREEMNALLWKMSFRVQANFAANLAKKGYGDVT